METTDQRWQHMRPDRIEVVVRPVKVCRHHADEVCTVLTVVAAAKLNAGDLRNGVGLVGWLQRPRQQRLLLDGLRRVLGIDAARTKEKQLADPSTIGGCDNVQLNPKVGDNEIRGARVVGENAS